MAPARTSVASLSLDLDDHWSYLRTRGNPDWEQLPSYIDVVVPRALDFLARRGLPATFFVVGLDAERPEHGPVLGAIAEHGHELGNHSFSHEPWLHLYSAERLEEEIGRTEEAILAATGQRPVGFRGPGYSLSPATLETLWRRCYLYDASTLPSFLGPLARLYYLRRTRLDQEQQAERRLLFGSLADGFRSLKPYRWRTPGGASLIELPVTTMPVLRIPIHCSYLLYLRRFSRALPRLYFRMAMTLCRLTGTEPSLLLHPLDFLGPGEADGLDFFPAMELPLETKLELVDDVLQILRQGRTVVTLREHARRAACRENLPTVASRLAEADG